LSNRKENERDLDIYLYQQFDEFLDKIIDRYGWTWFTQKQSQTEKKLIELEKRIEDLENK